MVEVMGRGAAFLTGGGEMGALIRAHDWASTPIGPVEAWPQTLVTLVKIMLGSAHPMFLTWGPEHTVLYNDGLIPILGNKHPSAIGRNHLVVWHETIDFLRPLFAEVFCGKSVHQENTVVHIQRGDYLEEATFTFSFNPVNGPKGTVDGAFCAIVE